MPPRDLWCINPVFQNEYFTSYCELFVRHPELDIMPTFLMNESEQWTDEPEDQEEPDQEEPMPWPPGLGTVDDPIDLTDVMEDSDDESEGTQPGEEIERAWDDIEYERQWAEFFDSLRTEQR